MLRLVERVFGEGRLHESTRPDAPISVAYELDVYRDWQVSGTDLSAGEWVIEGHLLAPADTLDALSGRGHPFLLHMAEGRQLEVFVLDGAGRVVNVEGTTFTAPPGR